MPALDGSAARAGAALVESIDGNYTNLVGLRLATARRLLGEPGRELLELRRGE